MLLLIFLYTYKILKKKSGNKSRSHCQTCKKRGNPKSKVQPLSNNQIQSKFLNTKHSSYFSNLSQRLKPRFPTYLIPPVDRW
ncbi:hypothetical protein HanPSC8_Chr04g0148691 [Helianthus annuus]|nr:hypothetical protein HanPSC8_Chr04g0148691 [Helianthus annuus]